MKLSNFTFQIESLLSVMLFAMYPTLAKAALSVGSPWVVVAGAELITAFLMIILYGVLPELKKIFIAYKAHEILPLIAIGIFSGVIGPLCSLKGLEHSSVINGVLILSIQTPLTLIFSALFLNEKMEIKHWLGVAIFTLGLLSYSTHFFSEGITLVPTDTYFFISAIAFGLSNIIYKQYLSHVSCELILLTRNTIGGMFIATAIVVGLIEGGVTLPLNLSFIKDIALIALIPVIAAQFLWYHSLENIKLTQASIFDALYPLFAGVIAMILGNELMNISDVLAGVLIIFGVIVSQMDSGRGIFSIFHRSENIAELQHFKHH